MTEKPRVRVSSDGVMLGDGLQNVVANLGTSRDKAAHTTYVPDILTSHELINTYRTSWLAAAVVDFPAEDATRKWRAWRAEAEQISRIEALEKRLQVKTKVQAALITSRLVGGSAIYINTGASDPTAPLVAGEEIRSLVVLSKDQLTAEAVVKDIDSEYFGKPEFYTLFSGATGDTTPVTIHASRFAIFPGSAIPGTTGTGTSGINGVWGDSVLQKSMSAVKATDSAIANIASMLYEANVDVMKVEGFADLLANNGDDLILRRARLQAAMKGINGMLMIDAGDDYQKKSANFSGLDSLLGKFFDWAAGSAKLPVTRLFGRAAAGLSGSGDGDERVYFDRIEDVQSDDIEPAIALLDECIITQALGGRPEEVYFEWRPLRQKSEAEMADIFTKYAQAARALAGTNAGEVIPLFALSDAMVNALTESGALPGLEGYVKENGTLSEEYEMVGGEQEPEAFGDAAPMPLYVSRKVTNAAAIRKHYADQGVDNLIDADDMHVTITYSREPVNWMKMGAAWNSRLTVEEGGPRLSEAFGPSNDTAVLTFLSSDLSWRHDDMVEQGASWDWPEYQPHITIAYDFTGQIDQVEPWTGEIVLGPEIFARIDE